MTITCYIGDVDEYLAKFAQSNDPTATLVTKENFQSITSGTYYTSVADMGSLTNFANLLRTANQIVYVPPPTGRWSDEKIGISKMKMWSEEYLKYFSFSVPVDNFSISTPDNKNNMLQLVDSRKTNNPQLWNAGCSISHGDGVEKSQRYGQLVSDQLNVPVTFLTFPGSSIIWSADQILRSDIREDDLVIWGITCSPRTPWFNNWKLNHILPNSYTRDSTLNRKFSLDYFTSEDVTYRTVISLFQVINYCSKIKAKLLLVSLLDSESSIVDYINNFTDLIVLCNLWGRNNNDKFIDLGTDNKHPGPDSHKFYANKILQKIKQLEWN